MQNGTIGCNPPLIDLLNKRNKEGTWNSRAKYTGQTHFDMEKVGKPSRLNTLRTLRVLQLYDQYISKDALL